MCFLAPIFIGETVLRVLNPFLWDFYNDRELGVRLKPFHWQSNSQGFNDEEFSEARTPGVTRVIAIGDSFSWSGGRKYNYWTLTEDQLKSRPGSKVEIFNQATSGTGPAYYLRLLKKFSLRYKPDIVVLCFFVGNDFVESEPGLFQIRRYNYSIDIVPGAQNRFSLEKSSYLYFFVTKSFWVLKDWWAKRWEWVQKKPVGTFSEKKYLAIETKRFQAAKNAFYVSRDWLWTRATLLRIQEELDARQVRFLVVILPDEFQVDENLRQAVVRRFKLKPTEYDPELTNKKLREFLDQRGVRYLDVLPAVKKASAHGSLYKFRNTHFNRAGNAVVATEVAKFLEAEIAEISRA
ncbi:MAG: SGNH/GDSL hydrolase family protein [Candidatus Omnitrophica bacterium]|nr:SGNH/GDSL hydrolase family protein [Candidatus Omnitrophota bacterium]